jgi:hypothetical protein
MTPEGDLVRAVLRYLELRDVFAWRNNTGMVRAEHRGKERIIRYGLPGSSDILGIDDLGRMWAVECKVGKNKPTALQDDFLRAVRSRGGVALVVRPDDFVELIDSEFE